MLSKSELIAFESEVAERFERGEIHAPVHLSGGNEDQLIEIFKDVRPEDWVFSTWRSHYHALLKGIPHEEVMRQILEGRSMFISSKEHNFYASSIMGGTLPIACGVAAGIKQKYNSEGGILNRHITAPMPKVWCFIGDMCASTGAFEDAFRFASKRSLEVHFVVEDNGLSTNTPTREAWGKGTFAHFQHRKYERTYPHYQSRSGGGRGF